MYFPCLFSLSLTYHCTVFQWCSIHLIRLSHRHWNNKKNKNIKVSLSLIVSHSLSLTVTHCHVRFDPNNIWDRMDTRLHDCITCLCSARHLNTQAKLIVKKSTNINICLDSRLQAINAHAHLRRPDEQCMYVCVFVWATFYTQKHTPHSPLPLYS